MKVVLINTPSIKRGITRDMAGGLGFGGGEGFFLLPLDLAYMAATLSAKGHEVKIIDADAERYTAAQVYERVSGYKPEALIATVSLPGLEDDCRFLMGLRGFSSCKIVAKTGIAFPPILDEILRKSRADLCIYGETDITIDAILRGRDMRGTATLKNGKIVIEENVTVDDMDELPRPARTLLPNEKYRYPLLGDRVTTIQSSRGCPYPCAYYCPYPLVQGRKWRPRSPRHILAEIKDIVNNFRIRKILFRDATFTLDKKRVEEICALIREERLDIDWWCETRIDCLDEEILAVMKEAGCKGINIGIETGDPVLMQEQAKIGLTMQKLEAIIDAGRKLKMGLHFLLMVGLPGETKGSLYKTYLLIRRLQPHSAGVCIVTPYPGTPLYDEARRRQWIETEDWSKFDGHQPTMHTDNLSVKDILYAYDSIRRALGLSAGGRFRRLKLAILDYKFRRWSSGKGRTL